MFQFQYGTIKRSKLAANSSDLSLFQFQYGTIKRDNTNPENRMITLFQFQYGTIKRASLVRKKATILCFNSNMVRLKALYDLTNKEPIDVSIPIWYD